MKISTMVNKLFKNKLNTLDWNLYKLLRDEGHIGLDNTITSTQILALNMGFTTDETVRASIYKIKCSNEIKRIVIASSKGYALASSEEEAIKYLDSDKKRACKQLKSNYEQRRKLSLNGQRKLKIGKYEKEFVKSISDDLLKERESNDEMNYTVKCPNCGEEVNYGKEIFMISGHIYCVNEGCREKLLSILGRND